MQISYSIDLHEREGAYFVSVHVEGEQAHEVGPMYDLAMAERVQNETADSVRMLIESKGRVARHYTMTPSNN